MEKMAAFDRERQLKAAYQLLEALSTGHPVRPSAPIPDPIPYGHHSDHGYDTSYGSSFEKTAFSNSDEKRSDSQKFGDISSTITISQEMETSTESKIPYHHFPEPPRLRRPYRPYAFIRGRGRATWFRVGGGGGCSFVPWRGRGSIRGQILGRGG